MHGTSSGPDGKTFRKSNDKKSNVLEIGVRFNVWHQINEKNNFYNHPAPFPFQLAADHIKTWSNEGDIVLDPFAGSGTSCAAAKYLKRNYIGIEISQKYCEVACKRLSQEMLF